MRVIATFAAIFSAVLFVPFSARALQRPAAASGTIQGTVTKSESGEPLAGARISLAGGAAGAQAMQNLLAFAATQGVVVPAPQPGTTDEQILQSLLDAAIARGKLRLHVADIGATRKHVRG